MMQKRKFTVVTQLHENNNADLINYIDTSRGTYAKANTYYKEIMINLSLNVIVKCPL